MALCNARHACLAAAVSSCKLLMRANETELHRYEINGDKVFCTTMVISFELRQSTQPYRSPFLSTNLGPALVIQH
jgi:hypothetical protein